MKLAAGQQAGTLMKWDRVAKAWCGLGEESGEDEYGSHWDVLRGNLIGGCKELAQSKNPETSLKELNGTFEQAKNEKVCQNLCWGIPLRLRRSSHSESTASQIVQEAISWLAATGLVLVARCKRPGEIAQWTCKALEASGFPRPQDQPHLSKIASDTFVDSDLSEELERYFCDLVGRGIQIGRVWDSCAFLLDVNGEVRRHARQRRVPVLGDADDGLEVGSLYLELLVPGAESAFPHVQRAAFRAADRRFVSALQHAHRWARCEVAGLDDGHGEEIARGDVRWWIEGWDQHVELRGSSLSAAFALGMRQLLLDEPWDLRCAITAALSREPGSESGRLAPVGAVSRKVTRSLRKRAVSRIVVHETNLDEAQLAAEAVGCGEGTIFQASTATDALPYISGTLGWLAGGGGYLESLIQKLNDTPWSRESRRLTLDDVYVLRPLTGPNEQPATAQDLIDARGRSVVLGGAGGGKSTFLKRSQIDFARHLREELLAQEMQLHDSRFQIPIWLRARQLLGGGHGFPAVVQQAMDHLMRQAPTRTRTNVARGVQQFVEEGRAWIVIDGVDELGKGDEFEHFRQRVEEIPWSVGCTFGCRSHDWDRMKERVPWNAEYRLHPLNPRFVATFVARWYRDAKHAGNSFNEYLQGLPPTTQHLVNASPLLLTFLCLLRDHDIGADLKEFAPIRIYEELWRYLLSGRWRTGETDRPETSDARKLSNTRGFIEDNIDDLMRVLSDEAWKAFSRSVEAAGQATVPEEGLSEIPKERLIERITPLLTGRMASEESATRDEGLTPKDLVDYWCAVGALQEASGGRSLEAPHGQLFDFLGAKGLEQTTLGNRRLRDGELSEFLWHSPRSQDIVAMAVASAPDAFVKLRRLEAQITKELRRDSGPGEWAQAARLVGSAAALAHQPSRTSKEAVAARRRCRELVLKSLFVTCPWHEHEHPGQKERVWREAVEDLLVPLMENEPGQRIQEWLELVRTRHVPEQRADELTELWKRLSDPTFHTLAGAELRSIGLWCAYVLKSRTDSQWTLEPAGAFQKQPSEAARAFSVRTAGRLHGEVVRSRLRRRAWLGPDLLVRAAVEAMGDLSPDFAWLNRRVRWEVRPLVEWSLVNVMDGWSKEAFEHARPEIDSSKLAAAGLRVLRRRAPLRKPDMAGSAGLVTSIVRSRENDHVAARALSTLGNLKWVPAIPEIRSRLLSPNTEELVRRQCLWALLRMPEDRVDRDELADNVQSLVDFGWLSTDVVGRVLGGSSREPLTLALVQRGLSDRRIAPHPVLWRIMSALTVTAFKVRSNDGGTTMAIDWDWWIERCTSELTDSTSECAYAAAGCLSRIAALHGDAEVWHGVVKSLAQRLAAAGGSLNVPHVAHIARALYFIKNNLERREPSGVLLFGPDSPPGLATETLQGLLGALQGSDAELREWSVRYVLQAVTAVMDQARSSNGGALQLEDDSLETLAQVTQRALEEGLKTEGFSLMEELAAWKHSGGGR